MRDINRDGLRELALVLESGENGYWDEWLNVLDFDAGRPRSVRTFQTYTGRCDLDDPEHRGRIRRYTLLVQPEPSPVFQATVTGKDTCRNTPERPYPGPLAPLKVDPILAKLTVIALPVPNSLPP